MRHSHAVVWYMPGSRSAEGHMKNRALREGPPRSCQPEAVPSLKNLQELTLLPVVDNDLLGGGGSPQGGVGGAG